MAVIVPILMRPQMIFRVHSSRLGPDGWVRRARDVLCMSNQGTSPKTVLSVMNFLTVDSDFYCSDCVEANRQCTEFLRVC